MIWCISPHCKKPQNPDHFLLCQSCHSPLLIEGRYRVTRLLGKGGFGKTYEVTDQLSQLPGSDLKVTKVLKILLLKDEKAISLFQQEARVLEHLNHPGIPKANHYFTFAPHPQEQWHCLVMEKIEGLDLRDYLKARNSSPISEKLALEWLTQLIDILGEVHSQNFFHRDIKPTNIMLKADGNLALIDFGSVRETTGTYLDKVAEEGVTGIISTGYTPAEQAMGKAVPQSDFFAVGRTFVYLLTGKVPGEFKEDPHTGQLKWRDQAPQISHKLANLIDYLMAPFPGNRPQTPEVILEHIQAINNAYLGSSSSNNSRLSTSGTLPSSGSPSKQGQKSWSEQLPQTARTIGKFLRTRPYIPATILFGVGVKTLLSIYQPFEAQGIQPVVQSDFSLSPQGIVDAQENTENSLVASSFQELTNSWTIDIATASIPEGWKMFQGQGVQLLLPEGYEGGNPEQDWGAISRTLQLTIPDYQQRLDEIEQSPNPVALVAFDLQVQELGFLTMVNIVSEFSQGKTLEEYSQGFISQLHQQNSAIEPVEQVSFEQFEAQRIITTTKTENGDKSQLIYLVFHQNRFWTITYSTSLDDFEQQLSVFEQSVESLEFMANVASQPQKIEIY